MPLFYPAWYELAELFAQSGRIRECEGFLDRCIQRLQGIPEAEPGIEQFIAFRRDIRRRFAA